MSRKEPALTALMIAPDRDLAERFRRTLAETGAFEILAELRSYPTVQALDVRLRQLKPDVVLLDLACDPERAPELIRFVASFQPATQVVGLHTRNDSEAVVRSLRLGASEFLCEPFDVSVQEAAIARLRRLRQPDSSAARESGQVVVFAAMKPGAGASTLAAQTAFALQRRDGGRVLLLDLDLAGGTIAGCLKLQPPGSLTDALGGCDRLDPAHWTSLIAQHDGIDVLAAPSGPDHPPPAPDRLHDFLAFTRLSYRWVVADVPAVPHRTALLALSGSDAAFLISTPELASLHLARRAVAVLERLGFTKDRFRVVINRASRRDDITSSDMEKVFNCAVSEIFPDDPHSLLRAVSLGRPLENGSKLGRAVDQFVARLAAEPSAQTRRAPATMKARPA